MSKLTLEDLKAITGTETEDNTKKERLQIERERLELAKGQAKLKEQQARERLEIQREKERTRREEQQRREEAREAKERRAFIVGICVSGGSLLVSIILALIILLRY